MHYLVVITAFLASTAAAVPTPAGGNSLADLIDGTASLAETDCTGIDEGTIAASGFICEEGTRGAESDATVDAQNNEGEGANTAADDKNDEEEQGADNAAEAQGAGNNNNNAQNTAEDAPGNNNDAQDVAQGAGNDQENEAADAADSEAGNNNSGGDAQEDEATDAGATGDGGAGVNLFDLALQGFQPVDCTGIDEAVVAASGFNCIDGTRGA